MKPDWYPDWAGATCLVVGSGESASKEIVEVFRGRIRVLVINTSYQLAPWADVLYGADEKWWLFHKEAPEFAGLKVTSHANKASSKNVRRLQLDMSCNEILDRSDGTCGVGGFSGFQAVNFAIHCGAKRLALLGFDFCGCHWHGKHPANLQQTREATRERWRERLDGQAERIKSLGVEVVNLSSESLLQNYPKMTPAEFLGEPLRAVA